MKESQVGPSVLWLEVTHSISCSPLATIKSHGPVHLQKIYMECLVSSAICHSSHTEFLQFQEYIRSQVYLSAFCISCLLCLVLSLPSSVPTSSPCPLTHTPNLGVILWKGTISLGAVLPYPVTISIEVHLTLEQCRGSGHWPLLSWKCMCKFWSPKNFASWKPYR